MASAAFYFLAAPASAQRRGGRRPSIPDTVVSTFNPLAAFAPMFTDRGNEFHSANGDPGPKFWSNRVDYILKANIDTVTKTLTATETSATPITAPMPYLIYGCRWIRTLIKKMPVPNSPAVFIPKAHRLPTVTNWNR